MRRRNTKKSNMKNPTAEAALGFNDGPSLYRRPLASTNRNGEFRGQVNKSDASRDCFPGTGDTPRAILSLFSMEIYAEIERRCRCPLNPTIPSRIRKSSRPKGTPWNCTVLSTRGHLSSFQRVVISKEIGSGEKRILLPNSSVLGRSQVQANVQGKNARRRAEKSTNRERQGENDVPGYNGQHGGRDSDDFALAREPNARRWSRPTP